MALSFSVIRVLLLTISVTLTLIDHAGAKGPYKCFVCKAESSGRSSSEGMTDLSEGSKPRGNPYAKCTEPKGKWGEYDCQHGCMTKKTKNGVERNCKQFGTAETKCSKTDPDECYCYENLCNNATSGATSSHSPSWWVVQLGAVLGAVMAILTSF